MFMLRSDVERILKCLAGEKRFTELDLINTTMIVKEYYANHWRDDDSPEAETTQGVKRYALAS